MLPFSKYMHKISPRTQTPIISVWINVFFCACLGLIDLASYTAIAAIFNVCKPPFSLTIDLCYRSRLELLHSNSLQGTSHKWCVLKLRSSGRRISPPDQSTSEEHLGTLMSGHVLGQPSSVSFSSSPQFDL